MLRTVLWTAFAAVVLSGPALAQAPGPGHRLGQAKYYLVEFEKEVARQQGGEKAVWRNK